MHSRQDLVDLLAAARLIRRLSPLLRSVGIRIERGSLDTVLQDGQQMLDFADSFNASFADEGWVAYERMNAPAALEALAAARRGDRQSAERILVAAHSPDAVTQNLFWLESVRCFRKRCRLALPFRQL